MRRYGAAMIGAGGGLVYLGLWAAAGPYALMERRVGILLLALTTVVATMLALHHEIEGLAIWALSGAYLAPLILATSPNPQGFLAYLEVIGLGTAITAYAMNWRLTFNLALFGYLILAGAGAGPAIATPLGAWMVAAAALLALHVTLQRSWSEARMGVVLWTWGILGIAIGSTALGLLAVGAERRGGRPGGRHAALALGAAAWVCLFTFALYDREHYGSSSLLVDPWALALYAFIAGSGVAAYWWGKEGRSAWLMWGLCGSAAFSGGSIQVQSNFGRLTPLAGDLALSVWWLLFAGGLVFLGFRLNHKLIRSIGLGVAAFAGLKIVLYDLAKLQALYRVGSFFALAMIALAVAYAYNQKARVEQHPVR